MAWIESHQNLEQHPKLLHLMKLTGWTLDEAIGKLHRLWWWVLNYAEDGDLSKHLPYVYLTRFSSNCTPSELYLHLQESKWITKNGLLHDWLDYAGRYLKGKYKTSNPKKLIEIYKKHKSPLSLPKVSLKDNQGKTKVSLKSATYLNLPTLTYLNLPKDKHFEKLWASYPNKLGKKTAQKHFNNSIKTEMDIGNLYKAMDHYLRSRRVKNGVIKDGKTFFHQWREWIDYTEDVCKECNDTGEFTSSTGYKSVCKCPAGQRKKVPTHGTPNLF